MGSPHFLLRSWEQTPKWKQMWSEFSSSHCSMFRVFKPFSGVLFLGQTGVVGGWEYWNRGSKSHICSTGDIQSGEMSTLHARDSNWQKQGPERYPNDACKRTEQASSRGARCQGQAFPTGRKVGNLQENKSRKRKSYRPSTQLNFTGKTVILSLWSSIISRPVLCQFDWQRLLHVATRFPHLSKETQTVLAV